MGFRVKRYGPASTMVVVGRLVGTFEPALVRHGAVPRAALAAVLGVAAEGVQVREVVGSDPPAKGSTVAKVRASLTDNPQPQPQ